MNNRFLLASPEKLSYRDMMEKSGAYLELTFDYSDPIEIGDLAALFAGIGEDFDQFLVREHPNIQGEARMFVREIKSGSLVANIFANIPDMIGLMDGVLIVGGFASLFSKRVRTWVSGQFVGGANKKDLNNAQNTLRALAKDPKGDLKITHYEYRKGILHEEVIADFSSIEAVSALATIESQKKELNKVETADHQRQLMTFKRMDKDPVKPGDGTGDRVLIESIDPNHKPVFYGSDIASQRIKSELTRSEYPFRLGFIVDVNVATKNGKISAYSVSMVHEVILLDEE